MSISNSRSLVCEDKVVQSSETHLILSDPSSVAIPINRKAGLDKLALSPRRTKVDIPLDIVVSLLRPDELTKLQKYVAAYLGKH